MTRIFKDFFSFLLIETKHDPSIKVEFMNLTNHFYLLNISIDIKEGPQW